MALACRGTSVFLDSSRNPQFTNRRLDLAAHSGSAHGSVCMALSFHATEPGSLVSI